MQTFSIDNEVLLHSYYKKLILENTKITYVGKALSCPSANTTYINVSDDPLSKYTKNKLSKMNIKIINTSILESHDLDTLMVTIQGLRDSMRLLIWQLRAGKQVTIFCNHGYNRSPGTVILALMKYAGMTLEDAVEECKKIRTHDGPMLCNEYIADAIISAMKNCSSKYTF